MRRRRWREGKGRAAGTGERGVSESGRGVLPRGNSQEKGERGSGRVIGGTCGGELGKDRGESEDSAGGAVRNPTLELFTYWFTKRGGARCFGLPAPIRVHTVLRCIAYFSL